MNISEAKSDPFARVVIWPTPVCKLYLLDVDSQEVEIIGWSRGRPSTEDEEVAERLAEEAASKVAHEQQPQTYGEENRIWYPAQPPPSYSAADDFSAKEFDRSSSPSSTGSGTGGYYQSLFSLARPAAASASASARRPYYSGGNTNTLPTDAHHRVMNSSQNVVHLGRLTYLNTL